MDCVWIEQVRRRLIWDLAPFRDIWLHDVESFARLCACSSFACRVNHNPTEFYVSVEKNPLILA